jgi:hypothetical protein
MPSSSEKRGVRERFLVSCAFGKNHEIRLVMLCGLFMLVVFCRFIGPIAITATAQERSPKDVSPPIVKPPAEQPVPFSHKLHLTFDMKCQECHPNPEPGDRMTLPAADRCMECHRTIAKDKPAIQKLAAFSKSKQTIPWVRIYTVSGWVFWNHRSHLESGMKCETCHGELRKMDVVIAATNVTTMAGCVDCHRKNEASTGCQYCHSGK